jgi:hypothetical protein
MFGSDKKPSAVANRINDNTNTNTGKVSLISNEKTLSTNDDIEWNNENKLKGGRKVDEKEFRDLSKRSAGHFQDGRQSIDDGHAFAYSSTIIEDYADWEVKDYLGKVLLN